MTEAHRCEKLAQSFYAVETRTHDFLIASRTLYRNATTPQRHTATSSDYVRRLFDSNAFWLTSGSFLLNRMEVLTLTLIHPVSTWTHWATLRRHSYLQWLKCNGTQGNAVLPPPIYGSKRSPTSDCYNARERHTTIVRGPNLNVAFPHL